MSYRPNLAAQMREIVNLDHVKPELWARTYEIWGVTADDVAAARDEEVARRLRNPAEAEDE